MFIADQISLKSFPQSQIWKAKSTWLRKNFDAEETKNITLRNNELIVPRGINWALAHINTFWLTFN